MLMDGRLPGLLGTLMERSRALQRRASQRRPASSGASRLTDLEVLCRRLLVGRGEVSGLKIAEAIAEKYAALDIDDRHRFFAMLAADYAPDWADLRDAFHLHEANRSRESFQGLVHALEPPRQELFRRINLALGGTAILLQMRADLLAAIRTRPELAVVDDDLSHLLRSWFNRGFLVMERIGWSTTANLLERIIRYEAVHQIGDWDELRRRLLPPDRRCYAFFHPALANDPLIFVEVALTRTIPASIQDLLAPDRKSLPPEQATTAVFYSISNCQPGLRGISFGNFLIKQVVDELARELPNLSTYVTLSPVPGFRQWLEAESSAIGRAPLLDEMLRDGHVPAAPSARNALMAELLPLAAEYLLDARDEQGRPLDPVARFHLGNGARLERLCWPGDVSATGMAASAGLMVNYLYDLPRVESYHEVYANQRVVVAGDAVRKYRGKTRGSGKEDVHVG